MNYNEFINNWLPNHCPINPWSGVFCVHLYVDDETNVIKNLHWLHSTSFGWQLNVHNTENEPIPYVVGLCDIKDHRPEIEVFRIGGNNGKI